MAKSMSKSQIAAHLAGKFQLKKKVSVGILEELAQLAHMAMKTPHD